ncbi:6-phosphogluconolactonase [Roseitranquillus sediminis]|uniref:6-phosphogluconolactonase n=1 Tax=Roseitranquillus sediminis TaxID=2809051 RepID=UPI001D0CA813|nr:6-phosphogluconolactonase [Roseitranquillus sediminis]MBM9593056.1 6-phosphogluconolactonase [Roseitranquillus sediminis]
MNLIEYPDRDLMMMDLASVLAGELNSYLMRHDEASFAVPGGTTPGPVFDALCAANIDWGRVRIVPTDERWLPESAPRSNARLIRRHLLTEHAAAATLVPLYAEAEQPEDRLEELTEAVRPLLPLTVCLLGMGTDLHVASIFPGADRLAEAMADDAPPLMAMRAPGAPEPRVTLTMPVLRGALSTHILITGAEKRAALDRARDADPAEAPVAALLDEATVHWAE